MTDLNIDGETFRVEVEGDPALPVLLLSNSLGTNLTLWDGQMPALLEKFRVVRYDSRGHGGSAVSAGPYSIGTLGHDALRILDALEIDRAHFAGISMGGAIGQWLITHAPERIERAVLICTAARFGTPESWNGRILAVQQRGLSDIVDATMERWFSPAFTAREPAEVARIRTMFLASPPAGYAACCAALRDMDLRQSLHGVETPVLIVTGSQDPVVSAADAAILEGALSNAQRITLDARHIANVEAGDRLIEAMVTFLTSKIAPRRKPTHRAPGSAPRGKAASHATAARRPLAKSPARSTRKAKAAAAKARKPAAVRRKARRPATATVAPKIVKTPPPKKTATKKAAAKKAVAKPTRRPTKTVAARGAVKKATAKAKPAKTSPDKTAASKATKKAATKPSKRPPAPRRKPATTPRRPTGRRKT